MAKQRHSKYKNTGILFELLVRQVTADAMSAKNKSTSVNIIKEFFKKGSELNKELRLYNQLMKTHFNSENKASALIEAVLSEHKTINRKLVSQQRYNLIKAIRENYNLESFFKTKLPDYKLYASVYKTLYTEKFNPAERVTSKFTLIEHICKKTAVEKTQRTEIVENFKQEEVGLRELTYKLLVEKFNKKYSSLDDGQREILKTYISYTNNTPELQESINKTIKNVLAKLNALKITDSVQKIKIDEIKSQLKAKYNKQPKDSTFTALLTSYELIKEISK